MWHAVAVETWRILRDKFQTCFPEQASLAVWQMTLCLCPSVWKVGRNRKSKRKSNTLSKNSRHTTVDICAGLAPVQRDFLHSKIYIKRKKDTECVWQGTGGGVLCWMSPPISHWCPQWGSRIVPRFSSLYKSHHKHFKTILRCFIPNWVPSHKKIHW